MLGTTEAWQGHRRVELGHAKQRSVLAVLLLEAGQVVPVPTLIDRVWGHEPPDGALSVLYGYVARLRRVLALAGVRLPRGSGGYLLEVDPAAVDVHRFRRLAAQAGAETDPARRVELCDEALALWRGTPFADAASPWLTGTREALGQLRLSVLVDRIGAYLALDRPADVLDELREQATAHPLDERLAGLLMVALYRSGRPSDALEAYRAARQALADRCGTEPGPHLRELHQRILRGDPTLAGPAGRAPDRPVPAGLPHDVAGFVGRREELARLDRLVHAAGAGRTVVISAVHGTAGVGKTALAVHWAHRVKARFPDGNLYADLRGYGPGAPADPAQVLDGFLAVLDVAPSRIPSDVDAKAALYRSLLDERRMLVVLDNAASPHQVRPLLPGSPGCVVVIASRSTLGGLAARDRAQPICLGVLPLDEAVALLAGFVGAERVAAEPDAARELALLCARLPVALCVAGERAAARPDYDLAKLVADLDPAGTRLDLLDADGDVQTAVRAVFSWSFDDLPHAAARLFGLLGLHPGPDFDEHAAAALAGVEPTRAAWLLDILVRAHLVERDRAGRCRMHDLLRAYAAECAQRDTMPHRDAALGRLFDFYLATAAAAMNALSPRDRHRRPEIARPDDLAMPAVDTAGSAQAWLDAERANLVAVTRLAAERAWPDRAGKLAATLRRYLFIGAHYTDAMDVQGHALQAARAAGDRAGEAAALLSQGQVHEAVGRNDQAQDRFERALAAFAAVGDRMGEARALFQLGTVFGARAQHEAATDHLTRAVAIFQEIGDPLGEANALSAVGEVLSRCGRYARARDHLVRALRIVEASGYPQGDGNILGALGDVYLWWGRHDEAREQFDRALAIFRQTGDRRMEARTINGLAEILRATGQPAESASRYRYGLRLAREVGARDEEARALDGLGHTLSATGHPQEARQHWEQALGIYAEHGFGEAEVIRRQLAGV